MFACRVRHLLGVLPRGLAPHAPSPSWHGAAARRHYRQLQEEEWEEDERGESRAVKVTVWWDLQRCRLPRRVDPRCLGARVTAALRRAGIRGPVEITAFGDATRIPTAEQEALTVTGVALSHVPSSGKDGSYRSLMPDIVSWIAQNPPPAHFLLISGDEEFASILHRLRMSNYNVLVSCPDVGSKMLRSAATFMWPWEPLVRGVDLEPKYINQPPDGLSPSWYGQYREYGHDPLLKPKKRMALRQYAKEHKVPKSVVIGIKQVLHFYPEGISVSNLRQELLRINVFIDKGFFGFRRFSALLKAMPDVVKFIDPLPGDTQPAVVGVFKSSVVSSEQSDFNGMDSAQSSIIEEKHHYESESESESEELSSLFDQPSLSELPSCTEKKTLETEVPSSPSEQLSRDHRKAPGLTELAEPPSNNVEADVTLTEDVPSPPSDAPSVGQGNAAAVDLVNKTEQPVNHMEADKVDAAGTPSSSGVQGNISNKRGLFGRISSLWNG
ncbi:uncharacterized protein LOC112902952 [Panicum hallii]|nr:uncharacterized protein LOC112902952 [Panicum hallii]